MPGVPFLSLGGQLTHYGVDRDTSSRERRQENRPRLKVRFGMAPMNTTREPVTEPRFGL